MGFVKLDTGILDSTLWIEKDQRDVFITALLMAEPREFNEPQPQIEVDSMVPTGFVVPPGWYGFCAAAGSGIIRRSLTEHFSGMKALRELGSPDPESRTKTFEGRRLIRINGGYIVLNYMSYRDRDYGAAERMRRLRERRKTQHLENVRRNSDTVPRNDTQAESREQRAEEVQNPSRAKAARATKTALSDIRHADFKEAIRRYWDSKNPGVQMPWGPMEGKQLGMWLREAPDITLEQFTGMLRGRYKSDVNHGDRPAQWIRWITSWGPSPVDRFNKPIQEGKNGSHKSVTGERVSDNLKAIAAAAQRRGVPGFDGIGGGDSKALPKPGPDGFSGGDHAGSRTVGPEILAPEGSKGAGGSAH